MENNRNDLTELVFILDRSGSMAGLVGDTIGGFNSMIEKQKQESGSCFVTTVLFNTDLTRLHDRVKLEEVRSMTGRDYVPAGCTALLDAVGDTVRHIAHIHHYARPEDVPGKTVVVITTDGLENSSRRYSAAEVKRLVEHEKEKYGWEFLFLGANIDAFDAAGSIGIDESHATNFRADAFGLHLGFEAVDRAVTCQRMRAPMSRDWKEEVEADFLNREQ